MIRKLKTAAYCRVSTDKDDQANSLASQRNYFAEYIRNHEGWILNSVYYDEGISGTQTKKRAGFNAMMEAAFRGEIDLILTKEVSRFARNTVDTLSYTRRLREIGVGVIFTIDNIDTRDSDGELRLTIMASIAQEESRKTSERVKWGQKRRMEQGVVFGRDLLGYRVKDGKLYMNREEARIVRAIFHKYTDEGKGTHVIARELLEEGMGSLTSGAWSNAVILKVLRNEKYVGDLCQKKTITPDYLTHVKKYNRGEEEMVCLRDHHEPIIERSLWERTQRELERRKRERDGGERHSNRYWCSGKLYCGICGRKYVSRYRNLKNGTRYQAWRCCTAVNYGAPKQDRTGRWMGCSNLQIKDETLLFCMGFCLSHIRCDQERLKKEILQEIREVKRGSFKETCTEEIRKETERIRRKRRKAIDLLLEGIITEEELKDQNTWYEKELDMLEKRLEQARKEEKASGRPGDGMEQYRKALDEILDLHTCSHKILCGELVEKICIYPDHKLDIWLTSLPFGIGLKFETSGKGEHFCVRVPETAVIRKKGHMDTDMPISVRTALPIS